MFLARVEDGKPVAVFPVDPRKVKMPKAGREKPRAIIQKHRPRAWMFNAERTSIGEKLSKPGAAALGKRPADAIAAAMNVYSQYEQARRRRAGQLSQATAKLVIDAIKENRKRKPTK